VPLLHPPRAATGDATTDPPTPRTTQGAP
jgi:hypothetical protein